jgi:outer membrane protein TolC
MRNFLFFVLSVSLLAAPGGVFAQGETLSLERARELGLQNSRSLAKFNLAVQSNVLSEKTQAYAGLPSLSLGASASTTLWNKEGTSGDLLKNDFSAGASLSVSQKLWDGGKNSIQRAISSLSTESARQDARGEYYAVLDSVDSAYYRVLENAAALEAAESSLETALLSLSIAEIRHESGMISDADYLQALAEKESREAARNQSRRDLALTKLKLKDLTGLPELPALEAADIDSREELIQFLAKLDDAGIDRFFASLWKEIQTRNPSLVKAALKSEQSEKSVSLAARDYSPILSASISTGLNYSAGGLEPGSGRLSINGSIPLDFWVTAANVEKQKIARDQAALDFRSAASSLDMELRTAVLDLISQAGQIVSSRRALDYARKHFDYVLELYRLSRNSPSELSDAETLLRTNWNQHIRSQYAFLSALSRLRSIGVFDSENDIITLAGTAALK